MLALTLHQPWATLIAIGAKRIETRSWPTGYRGPLAIHAAKGMPVYARAACVEYPIDSTLFNAFSDCNEIDDVLARLPFGVVVATCDLVDCQRITMENTPPEPEVSFGDYTPGRFAWVLKNIKPVYPPIPAVGHQGLWSIDDELLGLPAQVTLQDVTGRDQR